MVIVQDGGGSSNTVVIVVAVLASVVALVVIALLALAIIKRKALCGKDSKVEQHQYEDGYYGTEGYDSYAGSYGDQGKVSCVHPMPPSACVSKSSVLPRRLQHVLLRTCMHAVPLLEPGADAIQAPCIAGQLLSFNERQRRGIPAAPRLAAHGFYKRVSLRLGFVRGFAPFCHGRVRLDK